MAEAGGRPRHAGGAALVLTCLFDAWNWLLGHTPPAPAVETVGVAGGVVLGLSLLFGLAGGAFLFRIGLLWLEEDGSRPGVYRLWALCPVLWIWMRLARYEMSYVSAIDVYRSFYDFVMLIFIMLFFLFFARFAAGVGNPRPRLLVGVSLSAALCALTGRQPISLCSPWGTRTPPRHAPSRRRWISASGCSRSPSPMPRLMAGPMPRSRRSPSPTAGRTGKG